MKAMQGCGVRLGGSPVSCAIAAAGVVRATGAEIALLRRNLGLAQPFPHALLKHADEQTVVGLAAVCRAAQDYGLSDASFHDWGVLAAPRYFGRDAMASSGQGYESASLMK